MNDYEETEELFYKLGIDYDLSNYDDGTCISITKEYSGIRYVISFIFSEKGEFVETECDHKQE